MALLLSIDTATEMAGVALSLDGYILAQAQNEQQKDHASWLHVAVQDLLEHAGYTMKQLDAVAVTNGPGSYTGLRVALAAAKGFCYALDIPLITENTLRVMAYAASQQMDPGADLIICPMIDARRQEVFTAIYSRDMKEMLAPTAMILDKNSFDAYFEFDSMVFIGNGSIKWKAIVESPKASFQSITFIATYLAVMANRKYNLSEFTDARLAEPVYGKDFFTHVKK